MDLPTALAEPSDVTCRTGAPPMIANVVQDEVKHGSKPEIARLGTCRRMPSRAPLGARYCWPAKCAEDCYARGRAVRVALLGRAGCPFKGR